MDFYRKKFGHIPDLCLVHPSMMENGQRQVELGKLIIRPYKPVMPGHLWIGVEDQK